jgi:tRNA-dihydrouridine synthase
LTEGELLADPTPREKMEIAILHMDRLVKLKGESVAVREMRKHLAWYLKGLPGAARVKDVIMEETSRDNMAQILEGYIESLGAESEKPANSGSAQTDEVVYH